MKKSVTLETIISLAKRRGFIFQGSEIYGGLAGTWDYGPYGVLLKRNIQNLWWKRFVEEQERVYGLDAAILMNEKVWEASGHTGAGFTDPIIECKECHKRFRADHLAENLSGYDIGQAVVSGELKCPECKGEFGEVRNFNLMFETKVGAEGDMKSYLRPETAQGIFVNYKNVVDSIHPKLSFGIAQIGKAFRNEIAPRDFVFRTREFEQMELEYFVRPEEWESAFAHWQKVMNDFAKELGLKESAIHELEVSEADRAHYSKRTIDFEFEFPFGRKELWGLAYRGDHDLASHSKSSGVDLVYRDEGEEPFIPHVIEPSLGLDRTVLATLISAYAEESLDGEERVLLQLPFVIAPVKVAVFPLLKNKPELVEKAREVYEMLRKEIPQIMWDDNGNIGKRYRRQDEIGTPFCVTIDFDTLTDNTLTLRNRDTAKQVRVGVTSLVETIKEKAGF